MAVETVKMSSKGQIVIPQGIRESIHADEGTIFAAMGSNDTVILKKIATPSKEELLKDLSSIAKEGKKRLQSIGIKESDLTRITRR
ncbi:MAG: AbrB/MazE/SpoVT family DNA-binding domain-containing protein [Nanoarchaeota archaeon]|nr:AbrB/MazE/SpoVT family DNA-binding domain-containing protein [Nanoarchaeota archaeon]